jgi:hypothetical protein
MPLRAKTWLVLAAIFFLGITTASFLDHWPWMRKDSQNRGHGIAGYTMSGMILGLKTYETEYNRLPLEALTSSDQRAWQRARGSILDVLRPRNGERSTSNPLGINFYDPPLAREKRRGLYFDDQNAPILVDPWGEPYYFIIAFGDDGKVPNPDPRDNEKHPFLNTSIIMFSAGPDGNPNTWDDNVLSWK